MTFLNCSYQKKKVIRLCIPLESGSGWNGQWWRAGNRSERRLSCSQVDDLAGADLTRMRSLGSSHRNNPHEGNERTIMEALNMVTLKLLNIDVPIAASRKQDWICNNT